MVIDIEKKKSMSSNPSQGVRNTYALGMIVLRDFNILVDKTVLLFGEYRPTSLYPYRPPRLPPHKINI
jgi:hypothetical protein